jgi:hypothetical protein
MISGFTPQPGNAFDILEWGSLAGTFGAVNLPSLSPSLAWNTSQLYSTGVISIVAATLAGDFNNDGTVDAADYPVWRKGLGTTYTQSDYNIWRAHFGQTAGSGTGSHSFAQSAVPELPGPVLAILSTLLASVCGRCRRFSRPSIVLAIAGLSSIISPANAAPACAGDYNGDGFCTDAADYVVWRKHLGQSLPLYALPNEGASFGVVDSEDYKLWRDRFGGFAGAGSGLSEGFAPGAGVPEPSSLLLTIVGGFSAFAFARRARPKKPLGILGY